MQNQNRKGNGTILQKDIDVGQHHCGGRDDGLKWQAHWVKLAATDEDREEQMGVKSYIVVSKENSWL